MNARRRAGAPSGGRIGVIGAGTIGVVTQLVAQHHGNEVEIVDLSENRLGLARDLKASSAAHALTGEFDVIIDCVGSAVTHQASIDHLRPGGSAIWLGLFCPVAAFYAQGLIRHEKSVQGSFCYTNAEFPESLSLPPHSTPPANPPTDTRPCWCAGLLPQAGVKRDFGEFG